MKPSHPSSVLLTSAVSTRGRRASGDAVDCERVAVVLGAPNRWHRGVAARFFVTTWWLFEMPFPEQGWWDSVPGVVTTFVNTWGVGW